MTKQELADAWLKSKFDHKTYLRISNENRPYDAFSDTVYFAFEDGFDSAISCVVSYLNEYFKKYDADAAEWYAEKIHEKFGKKNNN